MILRASTTKSAWTGAPWFSDAVQNGAVNAGTDLVREVEESDGRRGHLGGSARSMSSERLGVLDVLGC